jgi:hypothetical protein
MSLHDLFIITKYSDQSVISISNQEKLETNKFLMFYRLIARIPKAFKDCLKENLLDIHFDTHDTTDSL